MYTAQTSVEKQWVELTWNYFGYIGMLCDMNQPTVRPSILPAWNATLQIAMELYIATRSLSLQMQMPRANKLWWPEIPFLLVYSSLIFPHKNSALRNWFVAKKFSVDGNRYLVSTSYGGGTIPSPTVVKTADFILIHGNGVGDPAKIIEMVNKTRKMECYTPKPIVFNEDDHFDFDKPLNNFIAATSTFASWGYFDYRMKNEGYDEGYQSIPINWRISSDRKKGFFDLLETIFVISKE